MTRHPFLLSKETSALVVVDMQDALLAAMHGRDALIANVALLVQSARILGVPVIATTQYAARLGPALPSLELGEATDKLCFSCVDSPAFNAQIAEKAGGRSQMVVCGVETHICVGQTAHDLLHAGFQVHVAVDAASSRTLEKHKLGMERIRDAGIRPAAAEAVVYEWLREAGTPAFKEILKLVKERP